MNSKSLRRLAADHGSLHTAGLPPNYLFDPSIPDPSSELTSLDVLLAGPTGTPYENGVWRLHLDIPPTYPTAPPTATFRTRIWHPNVDESNGAVCVETLKRDWSSTLKLRDVLVTISCLLIQPNPASALNEDAGKLASEDWEGFCRRARLMAGIHAQVPRGIGEAVREAQMRGEEQDVGEAKKEINSKVGRKGKGKEKVETPVVAEKASQTPVEDEENRKRRSETVGVESDPESDWIPGPVKISKPFAAPRLSDNVFGIKGMDNSTLDTPSTISGNADPQVIRGKVQTADADGFNLPDPVLSQPIKHHSFSLRVAGSSSMNPSSSTSPHKSSSESTSTTTINSHPLLQEFSYSWQDSQVLHSTGFTKNGLTKAEVRKRLASEEFEKQRVWELKRFKAAGYDLKRYNRGDFGPRTGIGRL